MKGQRGSHMIRSKRGTRSGKSLFTVYQVDIMGPQVDLAFCGNGQLTESHESHSTMSPVDIMVHPVDQVHCGTSINILAGRPGTRDLYPVAFFCSQLTEAFLCARSTSWGMMSTGYTRIPHFSQYSALFIFHSNFIKSNPDLH
eukprot:TRINITY_DN6398_c0_g1_i1.p1 TRINITY_DN6398_c0_g1~~TRINITY_DN6398_c0_g1_i1.p1  ORF type:complete len:143 (+),score=4.16 TRINITY_DN6398_c0_g1_i1:172-600(+)